MKVIITTTFEIEMSKELYDRVHSSEAELDKYCISSCYGNNTRKLVNAQLNGTVYPVSINDEVVVDCEKSGNSLLEWDFTARVKSLYTHNSIQYASIIDSEDNTYKVWASCLSPVKN